MNDEKLREKLGANIAAYRKRAGLTQAGLAEKLNYSDKAVSKWERGESLPDVLTLVQLSELFDVTVNDLLVDPNELPADGGKVQKVMEMVSEKALKRKADKKIVQLLCSTLVWFVALFAFVILSSLDIESGELIMKDDLPYCFPEFSEYLGKCRFSSCTHTVDKGCKILDALENGDIHESRHLSYVTMYNEVKNIKEWQL